MDGYKHPVKATGVRLTRQEMNDDQKKLFKNHHKCRTVLLNAIKDQVKETKALALIQKYEAFKMEDDENIEKMFSRFQMLTAGLRVLDKGYTKVDHVKKIIKACPEDGVQW